MRPLYIGTIGFTAIFADIMVLPGLLLLCVYGGPELFFLTLPVFILHEAAHIFAAYLFDCKISAFTLMPIGGTLSISNLANIKPLQTVMLYFFAPLANITFALLFYALSIACNSLIYAEFSYANTFMAIFSLLPIYPLDGGSILKTVLQQKLDQKRTFTILLIANITLCVLLTALGVYVYIKYSQFIWQITTMSFLFIYSTFKEKQASSANCISNIINKDIRLKTAGYIPSASVFVLESTLAINALRISKHNCFNTFIVTDSSFNKLGIVTEQELLDISMKIGTNATMLQIINYKKYAQCQR